MRRFVLAFVAVVLLATPSAAATWVWPVTGRVIRPFDPPATAYGPGHRGIDLAARPHAPVRAAAAGVVVFAGTIAHARWVVVLHPRRVRSSYGSLSGLRVHRGQHVRAGQLVGRAGRRGTIYFGVRIGPDYVDPRRFLEPVDLPALVHLALLDSDRVLHGQGFAH
jgi:murein DD-endopeptidase MepM/ murein hydrolase activator NlpD